jgi:hypothetical protein
MKPMKILAIVATLVISGQSAAIATEIPRKPIDSPARSIFLRQAAATLAACKNGRSPSVRKACDVQWVKTVQGG